MERFEITDRYQALGIPYPDPETMCHGQCEGIGFVPIQADCEDERYRQRWVEAEQMQPTDDGWHFVKCVDCEGSGKR